MFSPAQHTWSWNAKPTTAPLTLEGPLRWKKSSLRIFSCLRFQIVHGKHMVTARRRCFTNLSFSSKRGFLSCFDSWDFLSSTGFWTHANALEMSQVYQSKLCIAGSSLKTRTHPCTNLHVTCVCVHTETDILFLQLFLFWGGERVLVWFWGSFPLPSSPRKFSPGY